MQYQGPQHYWNQKSLVPKEKYFYGYYGMYGPEINKNMYKNVGGLNDLFNTEMCAKCDSCGVCNVYEGFNGGCSSCGIGGWDNWLKLLIIAIVLLYLFRFV